MKKIYFILFPALLFVGMLKAQSISFGYDAAGNRVSRTITLLPSQVKQQQDTTEAPEPFVEILDGERQIKIYPNPTKGMLAVEITGGNTDDNIRLSLYSLNGTQLQSFQSAIGTTLQVDMSAYAPATYILRLRAGDKPTEYKIIKQ